MANWKPIILVEIAVEGNGLYFASGQGDLSAPGDDLFWIALDANADPRHNLTLLGEVREHRLDPRFAAEVEVLIRRYEEMLEEDTEDSDPA